MANSQGTGHAQFNKYEAAEVIFHIKNLWKSQSRVCNERFLVNNFLSLSTDGRSNPH